MDRHSSFDRLFLEIRRRFPAPRIVETGCIRAAEDWRGAGYSTYVFGFFVSHFGHSLHSVDLNQGFCEFAARETAGFRNVHIHCGDSVAFLKSFHDGVDVAFLGIRTSPGSQSNALAETQAFLPLLNPRSLIVFDDTVHSSGAWHGKGETTVPWLLANGWRVFYSGHQTILESIPL